MVETNGADNADDFLARERALLGEDAEQFATPNDATAAAGATVADDDDLIGGDLPQGASEEIPGFESSFPAIETQNEVWQPVTIDLAMIRLTDWFHVYSKSHPVVPSLEPARPSQRPDTQATKSQKRSPSLSGMSRPTDIPHFALCVTCCERAPGLGSSALFFVANPLNIGNGVRDVMQTSPAVLNLPKRRKLLQSRRLRRTLMTSTFHTVTRPTSSAPRLRLRRNSSSPVVRIPLQGVPAGSGSPSWSMCLEKAAGEVPVALGRSGSASCCLI